MASAIIHICVAKELNKYLHMDEKLLFLGAIAPDISKQIGETKFKSHFLDGLTEDSIPNINRFLEKYSSEINKPFEMGYLIHLLTDKCWFRDYVYKYIERYEKKEEEKDLTYTGLKHLIYNDYTNLNIDLIDQYELSLDLFSNEFNYPKSIITEIPIDKLNVIVEKMGIIIIESKKGKKVVFNLRDIKTFIKECTEQIMKDLKEIGEKYG